MENRAMIVFLEAVAKGYRNAKQLWLSDRTNLFKDGRFSAYYTIKEAALKCDELHEMQAAVAKLYEKAKAEWLNDQKNHFKDGFLLACYEALHAFEETQFLPA